MSQKSTKVVIFTTAFRPLIGGSEIAIEEITRRLTGLQFDIITTRYRSAYPAFESSGNVSVYRVGFGLPIDRFIFPLTGFFKATALNRKSNYLKAHAYQASYGAMAGHMFKFFHKSIPFIITLQEGKNLDRQSFLIRMVRKHLIAQSDIITAISNYLCEYARRYNKKEAIHLIPNGVSAGQFKKPDNFDGRAFRQKLNINQEDKVIISASRLVAKNGLADLIKAVKELRLINSTLPIKCLLVGDSLLEKETEKKLKDLTRSLDLQDVVIFHGAVDYNKLSEYLWVSDVFVRPSLSEGLGIAFLDAMAAGLPVIGTDVGGIPDIIKDGVTGLLVKPGDYKALAQQINIMLSDESLRFSLVANGRKMVEEKYNWDKIASEFLKVYNS